MIRRIYVPLPPAAMEALANVAADERRHPSNQAALLLIRGLRQSGALHDEEPASPIPAASDSAA